MKQAHCPYTSSGCNGPEGECMGLPLCMSRRVRAGGPPPADIEDDEDDEAEEHKDAGEFAAVCAAYVVILMLVIGGVSFLIGVAA